VWMMQETKLADDRFPHLTFSAMGYDSAHFGEGRWNGVAILSKVGLDDVHSGFRRDDPVAWAHPAEARLIWATCGPVRCACVYVPNGRELDADHYHFKLDWLARLRDDLAVEVDVDVPFVIGGDWNVGAFKHTAWRAGRRLAIDPTDIPIKAADVTIGSIFSVIPQGLSEEPHYLEEKAKAVVILLRLDPRDLVEPEDKKDWSYNGIVAYSKVCTHVGCPVALYEQQTHHLLCPCHQSTFDVTDQCKVVFGPAKRPLPQLPITVDDEGYLIARSDFTEPVGPSFWERLK